jgi:MFS family permease
VRIALASQAIFSFLGFGATMMFLTDMKHDVGHKSSVELYREEDIESSEKLMESSSSMQTSNHQTSILVNDNNPLHKSLGRRKEKEEEEEEKNNNYDDDDGNDEIGQQKAVLNQSTISNNKKSVLKSPLLTPPTLLSVWLEHWKSLVVIALYACTLFMARTARDLILPLVSLSCGASPTQIGLVSSVSYLIDSSVFYIAGIIMDQAGRKVNAVSSPLFYVAGYLQLAFAITKEISVENHPSSSSTTMQPPHNSSFPESHHPFRSVLVSSIFHSIKNNNLMMMMNETTNVSSSYPLNHEANKYHSDHDMIDDDGNSSIDQMVLWWLVVAALVLGFANGLGSGLAMTLSSDIAPPDSQSRGHFLGIYRMFCDSGVLIGSLLVGIIAEEFSLSTSCLFCAGAALSATLQALFCIQETLPPSTPTARFFRKLLDCEINKRR